MFACFDAVRLYTYSSYSSLFFEHHKRILFCDWVLEYCSVFSFEGVHVTMHSYFTWAWPGLELASHSAVVLCQVNKQC